VVVVPSRTARIWRLRLHLPRRQPPEPSSGAVDADVTVLLSEWIVEPTPTSAEADGVTFVADNQGGDAHEMVVVRADSPADLPKDEDGAVDEAQIPEDEFTGEIEEFPNGAQRTPRSISSWAAMSYSATSPRLRTMARSSPTSPKAWQRRSPSSDRTGCRPGSRSALIGRVLLGVHRRSTLRSRVTKGSRASASTGR
jgi:hypothetical protein